MKTVPINFEYQDKCYSKFNWRLRPGGATYEHWHLLIGKYYNGILHYFVHAGRWFFDSPSGKFKDLEGWFEFYMASWFAS
jgi:hypothetical protein